MKQLLVEQRAAREIERAVGYYDCQVAGLGARLRREFQSAFHLILQHPERGAKYLATPYRFRRTKIFPYILIYKTEPQQVIIVAARHGRQRPIRRRG